MRKKVIVIGGIVLAVLVIVLGASYFILHRYVNKADKNTIYDNIYIGTVEVSGMKEKEAKKAIEEKVKEYQTQKMTFQVEEAEAEVTLEELGFSVKDVDKLIKEAVHYGKDGSVWSRFGKVRKLEKQKKKIASEYVVDQAKTEGVLQEKAQPLEQAAANASIGRENGAFVITDEVEGKKIDIESSVKKIEDYLNKEWDHKAAAVELVSTTDIPEITREKLEVIQDVLGTFTTYCGTGGGRVQNIESGSGHINGSLIMPGEEYSANAAMEPYTYDNGFTEAGSYENGQVVQSMGGGICQVSTTLYNAVILAELEVTQRQPHSMLVDYVEPSMDAAIAGDVKDLKFKNNTEDPIYIESYVSGGNLTFTIYGKETRAEGREIEFISETLSTKAAGKKFVASGAALGTMQKSGSAHTGKSARLWKVIRENGTEVSREVFNESSYMASPAIVNVGTASSNAEASAMVNAAISSQNEGQIQAAIAAAKAKIAEDELKKQQQQEQEQAAQQPEQPPAEGGTEQTAPAA